MNVTEILTLKFIRHTGNNDTYVTGNPIGIPNKDQRESATTLYVPYSSLTKDMETLYLRKATDFEKFEHAEFDFSDFDTPPKFSVEFKDYRIAKIRDDHGKWSEISLEGLSILMNTTYTKPPVAD